MTAEAELESFIAKFAPEMQTRIRACRQKLQARFPRSVQLVYYNFFVIGFGPTRRPSDANFSLAADRRGIQSLLLAAWPELPDPTSILRGRGSVARNVQLDAPDDLDRPDVMALIDAALRLAATPMETATGPELIIRSVAAQQRPRR